MSEETRFGLEQPFFLHGGDYNPDQWLEHPEIIERDFELMDKANCNTFSIGVFSWTKLEPSDGVFDFGWLDNILNLCEKHGKRVFLATPTGARPAWLGNQFPETNRILKDGTRARWNERENHCYTSPVMREHAARIVTRLAERYGNHPAVCGWHISNEFNGECFCPLCLERFHNYLKDKYKTLETFNQAAWAGFWSHIYTDWSQIDPRDCTLDLLDLEWKRFITVCTVEFMKLETDIIRTYSQAPVTTNMMGFYNGLDYWRLAEACDFIADDCYPSWDKEEPLKVGARVAMSHDMHYAMKNKPFLMMESCPGRPEWCVRKMRRAGEFEREMLLAIGHGADGTMYFQWRKGRGGMEKFHGAVVDHDGSNRTMIFKRVADYGAKLKTLAEIHGAAIQADCAVISDWESRWALMSTFGFQGAPGQEKENDMPLRHYSALWGCHVSIAVIEQVCDFSKYKFLIVPSLYMLKKGVAERLIQFTEKGGTLILTNMTGMVDENNQAILGGFPGNGLRKFCGVWNEDVDCPDPGEQTVMLNGFQLNERNSFPVTGRCEIIHAEDADVLATYGLDFYKGYPAITRKKAGAGYVFYIAADLDEEVLTAFYKLLLMNLKIKPLLPGLPDCVRVAKRSKDGHDYYFVQNFSNELQHLSLSGKMMNIWSGNAKGNKIYLGPGESTILRA